MKGKVVIKITKVLM